MNITDSKLLRWVLILCFAIILALSFLFYKQFLSNDKIVYVDSGRLLNEFKGAVTARKEFEKKMEAWKSNIDTLTQAIRNSMSEYESKSRTMNNKDAESARQLINKKRRDLAGYQKSIQEKAEQENASIMGPVISKVNKFLLKYGKTKGYKIILIANQSGTIAYGEEGLDITDAVLKAINEEYPQK